jgi:hypothetical protein
MSELVRKSTWFAALVAVAMSLPVEAKTVKRPLTDFLSKQGTTNGFFPPAPDYVGWTDGPFETFCLVDYAGLADFYLGGFLGTDVRGSIIEKALPDGGAEVQVILHTKNALGFAQDIADIIGSGFLGAPTVFGNKAVCDPSNDDDVCVEQGAPAAVGPASLKVTFKIAAPGADLPNLLDVVNTSAYSPVQLDFRSTTFDDAHALMKVQEKAESLEGGDLIYTKEVCEIRGRLRP